MGTKRCVLCDIPFIPEKDYYVTCGDCWSQGLVDGSEAQLKMLRALETILGAIETDWQMIADSAAGVKIAQEILTHMDKEMFRNLLRKVMRDYEAKS